MRTPAGVLLALAFAVFVGAFRGGGFAHAREDPPPSHGVCEREAGQLVGRNAVRPGGKIRAPKKIHNVSPVYPTFPAGTTGRGMWVGEALIDSRGKISQVWTIREVEITPPLPAFDKAITDAIRQWEFEPLRANKVAVPVCLTVTVNINWK
jgi:hypothetical protein